MNSISSIFQMDDSTKSARPCPERALALSVIAKALEDYGRHQWCLLQGQRTVLQYIGTELLPMMEDARLFLFSKNGSHRAAKSAWLEVAGLDAGWFEGWLKTFVRLQKKSGWEEFRIKKGRPLNRHTGD